MPARDRSDRPSMTRSYVLVRVAVGVVAGVVVGGVVASMRGAGSLAPTSGWIAFAAVFLLLTWGALRGMDAAATESHATREDPTAAISGTVLVVASVASLGGVALLLAGADSGGEVLEASLAVTSVSLSWVLVHTLFMLRYAALYYSGRDDGGIDFNQREAPDYADFAYLALTLGMTYQVSDTSISRRAIRHAALRHALLSYLLGAVVLAATINLVSGLAK